MKTPESLGTLIDSGIIQGVIRPLMSGKEAQVYVVSAGGQECVAKVYKDASQRTFKHRAEYTEGRRSRNTRDQRAVSKRTRHGREQDEAAWRSTEVDMIFRLRDAGVRVPEPIHFVDGVLVMELVVDEHGDPAPRLGDIELDPHEATAIHQQLLREVVRMLCAGVIHGDLSVFNVLMSASGPVLIDFPQAVDPSHNRNARKLLLRDVENLNRFVARYAPSQPIRPHAEEMWSLYEANRLAPDTELRGDYRVPKAITDTGEVLALIDDANREERGRRRARDDQPEHVSPPRPLRAVVDFTNEIQSRSGAEKPARRQAKGHRGENAEKSASAAGRASEGSAASPKARPRRRRRRKTSGTAATSSETAPTNAERATKAKRPATRDGNRPRPIQRNATPKPKSASKPADPPDDPTTRTSAKRRESPRRRRRRPSRRKKSQPPI
jgi:RIO kinase 1